VDHITRTDAMHMARNAAARAGLSARTTSAQAKRRPTARFEIHCDYLGPTDDRGRCPRCGMITDAMQDTRRVSRPHKPNRIGSLGYVTWWEGIGAARLDSPED
jgi:hypothetical protein